MKRLQGRDFYKVRHLLDVIKYIIYKNGHVQGIYIDKDGNIINHWLNDDEINLLELEDKDLIYNVVKTKKITYRDLLNLIYEDHIPKELWLCLLEKEIKYEYADNAYTIADERYEDDAFKYYLIDSLVDEQAANDKIIKIVDKWR